MNKYGKPLRFGYSPIPTATEPMRPVQLAGMAETYGLDYVGIQAPSYSAEHHELWTLLTAMGMSTKAITLFVLMPEMVVHSPALWAKAAASLDLLTNGRVEIGVGIGGAANPLAGMRSEKWSKAEALEALEEAIQVMRLMWSSEPVVHFAGKFCRLGEVQPGPTPTRRIGIWLGANEPNALALAGRLADGWTPNPYPVTQISDLQKLSQQLDEVAAATGRDPAEIQRVWHIAGTIGDMESDSPFQGSVSQWAELLAQLARDAGIDTFLLMEGPDAEAQLERFALEVVPRTRELIAPEVEAPVTAGIMRAVQGAGASGVTPAEEKTDDVDWVDATSMESFPASDPPGSSSFT